MRVDQSFRLAVALSVRPRRINSRQGFVTDNTRSMFDGLKYRGSFEHTLREANNVESPNQYRSIISILLSLFYLRQLNLSEWNLDGIAHRPGAGFIRGYAGYKG